MYAHLAARRKPLLAHLGEPREAWLPLDPKSVHYGYYSRNPQWHLYGKPEYPSHARLMDARDHILAKHPTLVVIGAHIGSLEYERRRSGEAARHVSKLPRRGLGADARPDTPAVEQGAGVLLKYQDRILYGTDQSWRPYRTPEVTPTDAERAKFAAGLEAQYRRDWAYYAGTGRSTTAANASRDSLCRRPCSRSSIGRTPSASSACASRPWCQLGCRRLSMIRANRAGVKTRQTALSCVPQG